MSGKISVRYELQRSDFSLDVDVDIPMRGITGVFGESGAGKTALLRCIAGLERGATGRLVIADEVWQDATKSRPVHEREIGYVFQEPRLFAHLNVRQNIEYGRRRGRRDDVGFDEAVELLGLRYLLDRRVDTLSGGEAQRVAIARALLRSPRVVLMRRSPYRSSTSAIASKKLSVSAIICWSWSAAGSWLPERYRRSCCAQTCRCSVARKPARSFMPMQSCTIPTTA